MASLPVRGIRLKWGDPAYTGSYVEGEWRYDVVGAAPKTSGDGLICRTCSPISQRGFSNFVLWKAPCAFPPELSSTEGTKKIQMIAFHLISSRLTRKIKLTDYLRCEVDLAT